MFSGTTFRDSSGQLLGAHQKIDRVARRALELMAPHSNFPAIKHILYFEGKNGPDGIKRKSPAQDEPWHYYNPADPHDTELTAMIENHNINLAAALKTNNQEKAAFEAAWLAHALVDGLTPAHHFPLEDKLVELRGEGIETRKSVKDKLIIRSEGDSHLRTLAKNWEFWGAKGVMTSHILFELGIATSIAPLRLKNGYPIAADIEQLSTEGIISIFKAAAQHIYDLDMYHRFLKKGWTNRLAKEVREDLVPTIVRVVTLAWYDALKKAHS